MSTEITEKRKEFALALLRELDWLYLQLDKAESDAESTSGEFYERAFNERKEELQSVIEKYHENLDRIRDINKEITTSINSWYEFIKDEKKLALITFPVAFLFRKKRLYKKISLLNGEITEITINNRFMKEKLAALGHQLETRAESLARSGENYLEYEALLTQQNAIVSDLKYLLPTIAGACPADISVSGIHKTMEALAAGAAKAS
jgi:chromosome segregation ATPase